jgi:hypothetical protein
VTRTTRAIAWATLVALAAFQAYAHRFVVGPDGVSYLDLSDAIVTGQWSRLLNLYWSPLFPALIGVARAITRVGAEHEIVVVHVVNLLAFGGMFAAFEYMLTSILSLTRDVRHSALGKRWGSAWSYALFGAFALTMLPMELTTPDVLNATLTFVAFGAMLRLRASAQPATRDAIALGAALGLAALAKSFMVPWAVVCFVTLAIAFGRRGLRPIVVAVGVWLAFVLPWSAALSAKAGRFTFGDAGRLTYVWFVNMEHAPAEGGVPPDARTARTEAILPGVGISNDTGYTDPMWADPARWNASLRPKVRLSDQLKTMKVFHVFYVDNLAPLLFLIFLIAVAPRGSRREIWAKGWIIYVPAAVGLVAYAMVVVTSRYVMPFILTGTLMLLATTPVARRLRPLHALLGLAVPVALESMVPLTLRSMWLITATIGGTLTAALVKARSAAVWVPVALVGAVVTLVFFPPSFPSLLRLAAAGLVVLFWRASLAAIRQWRSVAFAQRTFAGLMLLISILMIYRLWNRADQDLDALAKAAAPNYGNLPWKIAQDLVSHGITPGTRIALIGPHAESYWARTGRLHIVGSVPRNRVGEFWTLPKADQERLLAEFAANGATVAVATLGIAGQPPDSTWRPVKYRGRVRFLTRPAGDSLRLRD